MLIKELTLFTNTLDAEKEFYKNTLGFELKEVDADQFTVTIGLSQLTFRKSEKSHSYHYCFLIPSNQLEAAIAWLKNRVAIIEIEDKRIVQRFESWNADSVYFYDGSGNLGELIVRYDLENEEQTEFDVSSIISVNEIGVPTNDVSSLNKQLAQAMNTNFWKGDEHRFGTHGDQDGLLLLPNYNIKTTWFPTTLKIEPAPFIAKIQNGTVAYQLEYQAEELTITTSER